MKRLEKNEFKSLTSGISDNTKCNCKHLRLVRLYTFGANSDYGCLDCGMESSSLSDFISFENTVSGHAS